MSSVSKTFGPGGLLSEKFEGYEPRPGQVEMSRAVETALTKGSNLVCEAPTGTGKSLAYLVPAIAAEGRTVVVTANIALQEQLVKKDLPTLSEILPEPFTYTIAKGISNYVCLSSMEEAAQKGIKRKLPVVQREQFEQTEKWANKTVEGDLSELPYELDRLVRQWFTTTADECTGSKCSNALSCPALRAKARWQASKIIVTNYHLFFIDLEIRSKGGPGILPNHEHVVFDEAHKAADIARDFFGFRLTERGVVGLGRLVSDSKISDEVEKQAKAVFQQVRIHRESPRYKARIKIRNVAPATSKLRAALGLAAKDLRSASGSAGAELRQKMLEAASRCETVATNFGDVAELRPGSVYFVDGDSDRIALQSRKIDVSQLLLPGRA